MISRVPRNKKAIRRILGNDKKTSHRWQDLEILECLNATPAPLNEWLRQLRTKEIQRYQTYPVIDGDEDPLKWWQRSEVEFPMLCQLARNYLSVQASSSPTERLFSKAGLISTSSRAQLKPQKVDRLTFLAENL